MIENWIPVKDFEELYQISNHGRVMALKKTVLHCDNRIRTFPARILQTRANRKTGYVQIGLSRNNRVKQCYVHRLVAEAFIPNPKNKRCVNHKDGARSNNHVSNLEWCTHAENIGHAYATGLAKALSGEMANNRKITWSAAQELRDDVWAIVGQWAKENGVDPQTAWDVIAKKSWRHPVNGHRERCWSQS